MQNTPKIPGDRLVLGMISVFRTLVVDRSHRTEDLFHCDGTLAANHNQNGPTAQKGAHKRGSTS
jgi:hypothetical protein